MMFWITLVLLLLVNAKVNCAFLSCKAYHVYVREFYSNSERDQCVREDFFQFTYENNNYCRVPIKYSYCVCSSWSHEKNNIVPSNFLENKLRKQELLNKIYINDSFVSEIEVNAFNRVTNLRELYLQNNNISIIEKGVFNLLHNLTILDISNNQIIIIENKSFYGLTNLQKLNISHNKIQNISSDIFDKNLNSMRILDLSYNFISVIEFTAISSIFYHYSIYSDDIVENAHIPFGFNYAPTIKPTNYFLTVNVLNNSQLNLSFNKLKSFNFSQLNLNKLNLKNNNLDTLSDLENSKMIEELDISNNRLSIFNYAPESIKYLNLSDNILHNLTISLSNDSKIETLDVSQNLIKEIEPDAFNNMPNLTSLYLKNNDLTELRIGIFKNLKNLRLLSLSGNHLRQFEFGTFTGLSGLFELDISNNSFNTLNYKTFHMLTSLTNLNIAHNHLRTLDPNDILNYCDNIKVITLNDNPWNCKSLLNFTVALKQRRSVKIIKGSDSNTYNHLGHACNNDMVTEHPDAGIAIDNPIIKSELGEFKKFFESEFRNSNLYNAFEHYRNHSMPFPVNSNALNDYFNKDFKNTTFYKYFNKNISINFPNKYDEAFYNLTDTLKLLNLQLSNLNQTNVLNSELVNLTSNFENKFISLGLFNKTIVNPLNVNLAKLSKSVDEISNHFDKDFKEFYFRRLFQNDNSSQILHQINPEALTASNVSYAKLIAASEGNHEVVQQIENLRGSFIAFMTILIMILLVALLLPVIKRFINPFTKKSNSINTSESSGDLVLVQSIRHESLDEHNQ